VYGKHKLNVSTSLLPNMYGGLAVTDVAAVRRWRYDEAHLLRTAFRTLHMQSDFRCQAPVLKAELVGESDKVSRTSWWYFSQLTFTS
jgi:hypothetical protein